MRLRRRDAGLGNHTPLTRNLTTDDLSPFGQEMFRSHGLELMTVDGAMRAVRVRECECGCAKPSPFAHARKAKRPL